jgi:hypothetical protein
MLPSDLDISNSSALMCGQVLLMMLWQTLMLCHVRLSEKSSERFLENDVFMFVDGVPLVIREHMWLMHHDVPQHFCFAALENS